MKILAFPFAGGNKHSLSFLRRFVPKEIELITLDYPGRGTRIQESLLYDIHEIVEDAFSNVCQLIQHGDYIVYGHSMGALVATLLCKKIEDEGLNSPLKLIVSGRSAPSVERKKRNISDLPVHSFWQEVIALNGMPSGFMEEPSLKELFEPILRADFKVVEGYEYQENLLLNIPIDVFYGDQELKDLGDIDKWKEESNRPVTIHELKGDHFFIYNHGEYITKSLVKEFFQYH